VEEEGGAGEMGEEEEEAAILEFLIYNACP